jgi:hypothetical protein
MNGLPDIVQWASTQAMAASPWLMLGKGPSYAKLASANIDGYRLLALNHVVRERPVDIAHAIDLDVVQDCAQALLANAGVLWMPAHPHVDCKPSQRPLWSWCDEVPVLRTLAAQGRLAWYNASTWPTPHPGSPRVDVRYFSAEAALHALALCGARVVRSLGVDGGNRYAHTFDDLRGSTLLANGHASFDRQFAGFSRIIRSTGVQYSPLHIQSPVRVFVGTDPTQRAGLALLEDSIRRHASVSVQVQAIDDAAIPVPRLPANRGRTGFSFSRFGIPALCGHRGRAIYLDADMQVFADILSLWNHPLQDRTLLSAAVDPAWGRPPQHSVMLLDCARLGWDAARIVQGLDDGHYSYADLMQRMCIVPAQRQAAAQSPHWNSMEHFEPGSTRLLHYTDMPTQPWVSNANPHGEVFYTAFREALADGGIAPGLVYREVELGHVAPDFPAWVGLPPHPQVARLKRDWTPPYKRLLPAPALERRA